jgi:hypothetical protein
MMRRSGLSGVLRTCGVAGVVFANGFTPKEITGCVMWMRADLGITLTSAKISTWTDQSGAGNHGTQTTAADRPTYTASGGAGGQGYSGWDGAATFLSLPLDLAASPIAFVAAVDPASNTGNQSLLSSFDGSYELIVADSSADAQGQVGFYDNTAWQHAGSSTSTTGAQIITWNLATGASAAQIYRNGAALGGAVTFHSGHIHSTVALGALFNGTQNFSGKGYEFVLFKRALSASELKRLHRYMGARYAIAVA